MIVENYKREISRWLNSEDIHLYWKGRVALYALLKAAGVGEGDEVIIPAYTCVVVPNAVLYLKATPVYVDIDLTSYSANIDQIKCAIGPRTKVIVCQNTYGLSHNVDVIAEIAKQHKIISIEDCTHGFGGEYKGVPNGMTCDAAIYSTQWNKPYSTGIGGFSVTRSPQLLNALCRINKDLQEVSLINQLMLKAQLIARKVLLSETTYWPLMKLFRWLTSKGLVIGSSQPSEINGVEMPKDYFLKSSIVQAREGLKALKKLSADVELRKENASLYTSCLEKLGKNHVPRMYFGSHCFLKYPLLVKDREKFMSDAENDNIALGDWFASPLHPVEGDLSPWNFDNASFPVSTYCAKHVVNLPTDSSRISVVLKFIEKHKDNIFDDDLLSYS